MDPTQFNTFLKNKRIDSDKFRADLGSVWDQYLEEYVKGGEAAFDARKKFYLNNLRLQYPLDSEE